MYITSECMVIYKQLCSPRASLQERPTKREGKRREELKINWRQISSTDDAT